VVADRQLHRSLAVFLVQVFPNKILQMAAKGKRTMKDEDITHK